MPTIESPPAPADSDVVLEIRELRTHFETEEGLIRAVDGVSVFELYSIG